jgi:hypothetical protein
MEATLSWEVVRRILLVSTPRLVLEEGVEMEREVMVVAMPAQAIDQSPLLTFSHLIPGKVPSLGTGEENRREIPVLTLELLIERISTRGPEKQRKTSTVVLMEVASLD